MPDGSADLLRKSGFVCSETFPNELEGENDMKPMLYRTLTLSEPDAASADAEEVQICPYCGEPYSGVLGAIGAALHGVIWLLFTMFGLDNPFGK